MCKLGLDVPQMHVFFGLSRLLGEILFYCYIDSKVCKVILLWWGYTLGIAVTILNFLFKNRVIGCYKPHLRLLEAILDLKCAS